MSLNGVSDHLRPSAVQVIILSPKQKWRNCTVVAVNRDETSGTKDEDAIKVKSGCTRRQPGRQPVLSRPLASKLIIALVPPQVHYEGWDAKYDEWINLNHQKSRVHTYTCGSHSGMRTVNSIYCLSRHKHRNGDRSSCAQIRLASSRAVAILRPGLGELSPNQRLQVSQYHARLVARVVF